MPPKSQGESKQGLIITLVFFILATIGLGVAAYYGFAEQAALSAAKKEAENKEKLFKAERDYYQFQSQIYRVYMGLAENVPVADVGNKKADFDRGAMKIDTYKDKDDVTKVVKDLGQRFGWKDGKPGQTYEGLVAEMRGKYDALEKRNLGLKKDRDEKDKALKEATTALEQATTAYQQNLDKSKKENTDNQTNDREEISKLRKQLEGAGEQIAALQKKADQEKQDLGKQIAKLNADITQYKNLIEARNAEIAQFKVKSGEAPPNMRTDWKIVKMDTRGTRPYINLGSGDHVKPQLTFSIHGVGLDGRPVSQSKGSLEVVNVIGDHLSQARITNVKDPNRDPILQGDILYNPSWNPQIQKHVALAGVMDLTGTGRDNLHEFIRNLERQNIIVDAYLDPKDFTIKGKGITVRTDYLIIGQSGEYLETGARATDIERSKGLEKGVRQMQDQATKNGVPIMPLYKYLEMIGYRLPKSIGENQTIYDTNRRPEQAPRLGGDTPPGAVPNK